jgi:hypothetical protein
MWTIGILALVVVGVAVVIGVHQYQHKQKLAAFQTLIREDSGQAEASLGTITAREGTQGIRQAERERFIQAQRDFIAQVAAADMSDTPEVQREYVALLESEEQLMLTIGATEQSEFQTLQVVEDESHLKVSQEYACNQAMDFRDHMSTVMEDMKKVSKLEHNFQATCSKHGLAYEPVLSKYQVYFPKYFDNGQNDKALWYLCPRDSSGNPLRWEHN